MKHLKLNHPLFRLFGLIAFLLIVVMLALASRRLVTSPATSSAAAENTRLWTVHLYGIPGGDGTTLSAAAEPVRQRCEGGEVEFRAEYQGSATNVTGVEDPASQRFVAQFSNFFPCPNPSCTSIETGTLQVICKLPGENLVSDIIDFRRYYAPEAGETDIISEEGLAQLKTTATSLVGDRYVIVMPTNSWPAGPSAAGVSFVEQSYSFRDSSQVNFITGTMILSLGYGPLNQADPLTLRIFEWDAAAQVWLALPPPNLLRIDNSVNRPVDKFTTYVLGVTPVWCDGFLDNEGLDSASQDNINRLLAGAGKLKLADPALPGGIVSQPYTPSMRIDGWQTISYTANISAGAQLTVSVLSAAKSVLLPDVKAGDSLADIDPLNHPSLRLKVEMATTSDRSPELLEWCILAKPKATNVYLPLVIK